jgi:hypothetical protein
MDDNSSNQPNGGVLFSDNSGSPPDKAIVLDEGQIIIIPVFGDYGSFLLWAGVDISNGYRTAQGKTPSGVALVLRAGRSRSHVNRWSKTENPVK